MAYPGLPNWGYGLNLRPADLGLILGKLGIKNPYSDMNDAQMEQMRAQTAGFTGAEERAGALQPSTLSKAQTEAEFAPKTAQSGLDSDVALNKYRVDSSLVGAAQVLPNLMNYTTGAFTSPFGEEIIRRLLGDNGIVPSSTGTTDGGLPAGGLGASLEKAKAGRAATKAEKQRTAEGNKGWLGQVIPSLLENVHGALGGTVEDPSRGSTSLFDVGANIAGGTPTLLEQPIPPAVLAILQRLFGQPSGTSLGVGIAAPPQIPQTPQTNAVSPPQQLDENLLRQAMELISRDTQRR